MSEALYGPGGFYTRPGTPGRHFRTAAHASPLWAAAIAELARRVDRALGSPGGMTVVDLGAGGGELLAGLAALVPERVRLLGVDLAPRPEGLPERVAWAGALPDHVEGLLLAVEWLDVVPVDVVEQTVTGPRLVEVAADGTERYAGPPDPAAADWLSRWWPLTVVGGRAEIGDARDRAWAGAAGRVSRGSAVAIDYAVVPARDLGGTLTGFRAGRAGPPVPDGTGDLTAHVLFDALTTDGDVVVDQAEALTRLGFGSAGRPAYDGDPQRWLQQLAAAGELAELRDRSGLGGFTWLVRPVGIPPPL
jgi:SAM-dependent MidA family methyltransferase